MNKNDYIVLKLEDNTCIYHIPSKRRFKLDVDLYSRFKAYLYDNKDDIEIENLLNSILDDTKDPINVNKIKRLEIMTSTCCNLNCRYCYANGGNYKTKEMIMDISMADQIINYVSKRCNCKD